MGIEIETEHCALGTSVKATAVEDTAFSYVGLPPQGARPMG